MAAARAARSPGRRPLVQVAGIAVATVATLLLAGGVALVLGVRSVVDVVVALDAPRTTEWRSLESTWPRSPGATTCNAWHEQMTRVQQTVAAAEMLLLSLARDGWARRPSDADVEDLRFNVSEVCAEQPTAVVGEVGAGIYQRFESGYRWGVETLHR